MSHEPRLGLYVEEASRRAGGDDQRVAGVLVAIACDGKGPLGQIDRVDRLEFALGTKALRLLAHQIDEFWTHDTVGEAGVVFDIRGNG